MQEPFRGSGNGRSAARNKKGHDSLSTLRHHSRSTRAVHFWYSLLMAKRRYWLLKTEPDVFSFEDLVAAPRRTTHWEGVRNYQARNLLRDELKKGDGVLIYHSNAEPPAAVGLAEVVREGYPDTAALDPKSEYFDPKAKAKGESPWCVVDVKATHRFGAPLPLSDLRGLAPLKDMVLLRKGSRLSVQPVTEAEFEFICSKGRPAKV